MNRTRNPKSDPWDSYLRDMRRDTVDRMTKLKILNSQLRLLWFLPVDDCVRLAWIKKAHRQLGAM